MTVPGSGGFVWRAGRSSLEQPTATGEVVGPGTYGAHYTGAEPITQPAPFTTSAVRNLLENTTTFAMTPGPGAYAATEALDALQLKRVLPAGNTAVFASGVDRLPKDVTKGPVPGPGSYDDGSSWIRRSTRYQAPAPKQRVIFERVNNPPSIPNRHQSYGYEESDEGRLVRQGSPEKVITGEGLDSVGPGQYNPSLSGIVGSKATSFGNSRAKRGQKYTSEAPGPGTYNLRKDLVKGGAGGIVVNFNGVEVVFGGAAGTSSFATRSALPYQRVPQEHEVTPGPGAYQEPPPVRTGPLPREQQNFGCRTARSVDLSKSRSAPTYLRTPGPGAYDDPRKSVNMYTMLSDPLPFSSTTQRFGSNTNGVPGPGEYKPEALSAVATEAQRKAQIAKYGVFGTNASRFPSRAMSDDGPSTSPGPGDYNPFVQPSRPRPKRDTSIFASKTDRFRPISAPVAAIDPTTSADPDGTMARGDPSRIGPGSYQPPDTWGKPSRHPGFKKAAFGSDAQRAKLSVDKGTPGPGRYNAPTEIDSIFRPFTVPAKSTGFGSQQAKLKMAPKYTPGPGTYLGHSDLSKKTFNITYTVAA